MEGGSGSDDIASQVSGYSCGRGHGSWVKPGFDPGLTLGKNAIHCCTDHWRLSVEEATGGEGKKERQTDMQNEKTKQLNNEITK